MPERGAAWGGSGLGQSVAGSCRWRSSAAACSGALRLCSASPSLRLRLRPLSLLVTLSVRTTTTTNPTKNLF